MIKNYLITTLRTLFRNRFHTSINVLGLTLGVTCSLVLFLMANYANSYDDFQEHKDRIYRIVNSSDGAGGEKDYTPGVPLPLPEALRTDFPEFKKVVFTSGHYGEMLFTIHPEREQPVYFESQDDRLIYTEQQYLEIFTINWLEGNRDMALSKPNQVVLARSVAEKFFPEGDALSQHIIFNKNTQLQVSGIMSDPEPNTDMPFDMLVSLPTIQAQIDEGSWNSVSSDDQCYILMARNDDPERYSSRLDDFVVKHFGEDNGNEKYELQPMSDLHFNDEWSNYSYSTVSENEILVIYIIGIFLLITACINFINLSTAVAVRRSREVGIRKVLGGTRNQLVFQFLGETFIIISVSVLCALGLAELLILYINPFMQISLDIHWSDPVFILSIFSGTLFITFLSGFYPAMVLARFRPAIALKNLITTKHSGAVSLRKGLVVFQFFISQAFIIGTIIIISQMKYVQNVDLGFKTDALINIRIPERDPEQKKTLKNELSRLAGVEQVSLIYSNPSSGSVSVSNFSTEDHPEDFYTAMKYGDENYIDIYGIELLAGRGLRESDTLREVVVNEKLLKYIEHKGSPEEAIGKQVNVHGSYVPIVGVVKDFHSVSLHSELMTIMLMNGINDYRQVTLKVNMQDFEATNAAIKDTWKKLYPEYEYNYSFVDEQLREFYEGERKMAKIFSFFSGVAILIGCLGLFGLASFMVNQKVKEIGVRKVLGASIGNIVGMFSISFFKLIGIAFILAVPVSWYVMTNWLENFEYRVELGPVFFLAALLITLMIAIVTVGYKSLKAASANPVDSLRSE